MTLMQKCAMRLLPPGKRVVDAELVRRISDVRRLEEKMQADYRALRQRVARRLRSHRQRVAQAIKLERLMAAGYAFASDQAAWQQWRESMRLALEHAVAEIGLALPRDSLLEKQMEKAIALATRSTVPLTVHVNSGTQPAVQHMLAALHWPEEAMAHAIVITEYLEDDSCIIETPSGLFEANVGLEVEAFGDGIKAYLRGLPSTAGVQGPR